MLHSLFVLASPAILASAQAYSGLNAKVPLKFVHGSYKLTAELEFGPDRQKVMGAIDTGSGDVLVLDNTNGLCRTLDPRVYETCLKSSLKPQEFEVLSPYYMRYLDGTEVNGSMVRTSVTLGNGVLESFDLAAINDTERLRMGIFGLGMHYSQSPATAGYPGLVEAMRNQGQADSAAFGISVYSDFSGDLFFGDQKYHDFKGQLISYFVSRGFPGRQHYSLPFDKVYTDSWSYDIKGQQVVLDTGTSLHQLPQGLLDKIGEHYKAECEFGICFVECDVDPNIKISIYAIEYDIRVVMPTPEDGVCIIAGQPTRNEGQILLGMPFFAEKYIFFDSEHEEIGIAVGT